jgi:hypothetical protein
MSSAFPQESPMPLPRPALTPKEWQEVARRIACEHPHKLSRVQWMEALLQIRDKQNRLVPLRLNPIQRKLEQELSGRDYILKPRQVGVSTLIEAILYHDTRLNPNRHTVVIAHDLESTERIFQMVQRFERMLPDSERARLSTRRSNRRELWWSETDSQFIVGTAGSWTFGRAQTVDNVHASEFAFWPNPEETLASILEAVPAGGRVVIETTPHGQNYAWDFWQKHAEGDLNLPRFKRHFFPWWEDPTYRLEGVLDPPGLSEDELALRTEHGLDDAQIRWRRAKRFDLGDRFDQEYPEDPARCFLRSGRPVFGDEAVGWLESRPRVQGDEREAIWEEPQPNAVYVVGADPAEGLSESDPSAAVVVRRPEEAGVPMRMVARIRGQWPPDVFAAKLYTLSQRYNRAELVVERNNHGHAVLLELEYLRANVWTDHRRGTEAQAGFLTNQASKVLLIDRLDKSLRERSLVVPCEATVAELRAYQHLEDATLGAPSGAHDDLVMALALANYVCLEPRRPAPQVRWI